jgi:hypothetical protein
MVLVDLKESVDGVLARKNIDCDVYIEDDHITVECPVGEIDPMLVVRLLETETRSQHKDTQQNDKKTILFFTE